MLSLSLLLGVDSLVAAWVPPLLLFGVICNSVCFEGWLLVDDY